MREGRAGKKRGRVCGEGDQEWAGGFGLMGRKMENGSGGSELECGGGGGWSGMEGGWNVRGGEADEMRRWWVVE